MRRVIQCAAMALVAMGIVTAPPANAEELPSNKETLELLRDQWGRTTFPKTGVGDWQQLAHWTRVRQHLFKPGTNEFTSKPEEVVGLKPRTVQLFERATPNGAERGVIEDVTEADGSVTHNYFPPFRGHRDDFVFYNNVAPATGEYEETCRKLEHAGEPYLGCRIIRPDRGVYYQVNVQTGALPRPLPDVQEVMAAFRDQWGRDDFAETGIGAWTQVAAWDRKRILFFDPGENEFNNPGEEAVGIPVQFEQYRRTLPGGKVQHTVFHTVTLPSPPHKPGTTATTYVPPFKGNQESFTFYVNNTAAENPMAPVGEFEETCRILHTPSDDFLICRTITPLGAINYQTAARM